MAWHTLNFVDSKIQRWFDKHFFTIIGVTVGGGLLLLLTIAIHLCYEKISNDASYNYRLDVNGLNSIYLNEGEFELKDGRISFEKDGTIYHFTNFRLTNLSK